MENYINFNMFLYKKLREREKVLIENKNAWDTNRRWVSNYL